MPHASWPLLLHHRKPSQNPPRGTRQVEFMLSELVMNRGCQHYGQRIFVHSSEDERRRERDYSRSKPLQIMALQIYGRRGIMGIARLRFTNSPCYRDLDTARSSEQSQ